MRTFIILFLAATVSFATVLSAIAATTMLDDFTQNELDTNWEPDRQAPSDGTTSVNAFGRSNVARLGIDSSATQDSTFRRTEGIKTLDSMNFGDGVHVDLYLDPDWQGKAVRAGFWVVGDDGAGDRDNLFAIIEFVNNEPCPVDDCSNQGNITDHEGWRVWDSVNGWTNLPTAFAYGQWFTLAIELDPVAELYHFSIDDEEVATGPGGQNFVREVFLNSYNYGLDDFPNLSSDDYAAHWHAGIVHAVGESTYVLCANVHTGQLSSPLDGQCGPGHIEVTTPSVTPLVFCVSIYTGNVQYSASQTCNPPRQPHVVPDDGDLLTCVSIYTGKHRRVFSHAQCFSIERPNLIPAG